MCVWKTELEDQGITDNAESWSIQYPLAALFIPKFEAEMLNKCTSFKGHWYLFSNGPGRRGLKPAQMGVGEGGVGLPASAAQLLNSWTRAPRCTRPARVSGDVGHGHKP